MKDLLLVVNEILDGDTAGGLEFVMKRGAEDTLTKCLYNVASQNPAVKDLIVDVAARLYFDAQKEAGIFKAS